MSSLCKFGWRVVSAASLALSLAAVPFNAQALSLTTTLPTTNLDANATFSFSSDGQYVLEVMGFAVSGLGNAKQAAGGGLAFDMPITQVSIATSLLPLSLSPVSGQASGSALGIYGETGGLVLANFALDFKRNVLAADLTTAGGTLKNFDIYSFTVSNGLHLSTAGGLSMQMSLDHMMLTTGAQAKFTDALVLPDFAAAILGNIDFGSLAINISPGLRLNVSDKAYLASAVVPETRPVLMMMLGMLGIAVVSRRKQRD
jgi:hypothetical protein